MTSGQQRHARSLVWVTLPHEEESMTAEPETPARVAHCELGRGGEVLIGVAFEARGLAVGVARQAGVGGVGSRVSSPARKHLEVGEQRQHKRVALALFVRVFRCAQLGQSEVHAPEDAPWPEETMTLNVSRGGTLFCTLRTYEAGDRVRIAFPKGGMFPDGERSARVMHVAALDAESPLLCVGVEFISAGNGRR